MDTSLVKKSKQLNSFPSEKRIAILMLEARNRAVLEVVVPGTDAG